ncbi:MFS transporter [Calidifontibacter sp. DB0510]|uniref:MFS transporter n=1 Tax=Metallococcus carri TaxID=1656884 RepID=A0A967B6A1_9MICO|nr:MFS transporter [Metallococcus carri]NHN56367.1 MFS transporter [Metallococcus carri]NOP35991.1 MFS transporter [Calidifontibacter sp. DB2511S]
MPSSHSSLALGLGIIGLEFAAAVTVFVSSTLLPVIAADLHARDRLGLLIAGSTLGMFVSMPLSGRAIRAFSATQVLGGGLVLSIGGTAMASLADGPVVFAVGRAIAGFASGLLAVFGLSAAIRHLSDDVRVRVIAATAAMWILPALVGPPITLGLNAIVGWRWTLLLPLPFVVVGRVLVARATRDDPGEQDIRHTSWNALLVPVGVGLMVVAADRPLAIVVGTVIALIGFAALVPRGTLRARVGAPAGVAALTLFGLGFFGADGLVTVLFTDGFGTDLRAAGLALSAAPLAWSLSTPLVPRLRTRGLLPSTALCLAVTGLCVLALAVAVATGAPYPLVILAWAVAGVGVGLAYPTLYLAASTPPEGTGATELAAAVITAESFGALLGGSAGSTVLTLTGLGHAARVQGLTIAYAGFGVVVLLAAVLATRLAPARPPTEQSA